MNGSQISQLTDLDLCEQRHEEIDTILNGLDRYNPNTTVTLQEYVSTQCEAKFVDTYANLALLKLYQFNPNLANADTITNILVKALTTFQSASFALCLHLLPPIYLVRPPTSDTSQTVQKLAYLNELLCSADFVTFWDEIADDDTYAELTGDVEGFEDSIRYGIASQVADLHRTIEPDVLASWLGVSTAKLPGWVKAFGWKLEDEVVTLPDKQAATQARSKMEVIQIKDFSRIIRRAYEQQV